MAIWIVTVSVAQGQEGPRSLCSFDGFGANPRLAEVAGDPMLVSGVEGDWTCGYLSNRTGAAPLWVRSVDLRPVSSDPRPPLSAWLGIWTYGEERIGIQASKTQRMLELTGKATWHGRGDVVNYGQFADGVAPSGNHLHLMEGGEGSCAVDLMLIGKYIVASDNQMCGGVNVRFMGIFTRKRP